MMSVFPAQGIRMSTVENSFTMIRYDSIFHLAVFHAGVLFWAWFAPYAGQTFAADKDTVIVGSGGPGPYGLGESFIDTSSLRISRADSAVSQVPAYIFIGKTNALLFAAPIDSGLRLKIHFRTRLYGLPKTYVLFDKTYADYPDSSIRAADSVLSHMPNVFAEENLTVSGYKSIGISVNNMGSMNLEQALDVNLSGEIAPHTVLSGHLTDQGSSLEGSTREVADLDMVYVALDNPRYNVLVGDQYAQWPVAAGMLSGKKKIKGVGVGLTLPAVSLKAFGALSSGKFAVQTIVGRSGLQGPYRLTGEGEEGFIMVIQGTVHVFVGDKKFQEGADQEFTVDYDLGSISFTPRTLIKNEDIIRVEYEYRIFDYQRTFSGASLASTNRDSSLTVQGGLWYETDNKNQPIDLSLSPGDISRLAVAGDSANITFGGRLIDPKDVAWQSAQTPLYKDSAGIFVFKPFNPQNAADNQGYFYVTFRTVGASKGDYSLDYSAMESHPGLGNIYSYAGPGNGSATLPPIPLPQSTVTGEMLVKAAAPWASMKLDVAGMNHDRNLFSSRGNVDKNGVAVDASAVLGSKRLDRKSAWFGGGFTHVTADMTQEVSSSYDRERTWDDTTNATRTGLRQSWQSSGGVAFLPHSFAEGAYGQYIHDGRLVTDRLAAAAQMEMNKRLSLDYRGEYFRHYGQGDADKTRRGDGHCTYTAPFGEAQLEYKDEWRTAAAGPNRGMAGAGVNVHALPLALKESLFYTQYRKSDGGLYSAKDTGFSLLWDHELNKTFTPAWNAGMTSHYFLQNLFNRSVTATALVTAHNEVSVPSKGLFTRQTYQVTIEQASAMVQVPVPVGKGLGDHAWDTTVKEYVPAKNGDYIIQEQEIYGNASDNRVRKAQFNATWSLSRPTKRHWGIVSDLGWSGTLSIDEQLNIGRFLGFFSWVPGYTSLFTSNGLMDSLVRFADIYYRQNIDWIPDSLRGWRGQAYAQPLLKKIRDYSETGLQWGGGLNRTVRFWVISMDADVLSVNRRGSVSSSPDNFNIVDRHAQLTEQYTFYRDFSSYCKETAGWSSKSSDPISRGWYFRLMPGIMWQPGAKGSADLSYTYASVGIPGILDYRMAQGFAPGISHTIDLNAHLNFGTHFMTDISYRSQFGLNVSSRGGLHTVSMQMKALL